MSLNFNRLRSLESHGIFASGEDYEVWAGWAATIRGMLDAVNEETKFKSSLPNEEKSYKAILTVLKLSPEDSINYVTYDMLHRGVTWVHLCLLFAMVPAFNPKPEHAGRFSLLIADWIYYYEKELLFT